MCSNIRLDVARAGVMLLVGLFSCAAGAQTLEDANVGRQAIAQLANAFARMESIEVEWIPADAPTGAQSGTPVAPRARTRGVVARDGRFAYEEFDYPPSPTTPRLPGVPLRDADGKFTGEELRYFVFHDLTHLLTTDGDAGLYFKSRLTEPALSLPPRPQYDLAPWPVLGVLIERMLKVDGTSFEHHGENWIARTPLAHDRSFELEWTEHRELGPWLTRIRRVASDATFTTHFSGVRHEQGFALPARREDDGVFDQKGEQRRIHTARVIRVLAINPPDIDARVTFDPEKYSMHYVDSATGNVHAQEGGPVLYHPRDLDAAFDREHAKASLLGRSWFAGVIAATAGSLVMLWRKLKGGGS